MFYPSKSFNITINTQMIKSTMFLQKFSLYNPNSHTNVISL